MIFNRDDASTWPCFRPLIIAHDVGRSQDRSTAVVGGNSPFEPRLLGTGQVNPDFLRPTNYAGDFTQLEQRVGQIGFRFTF